VVLYGLPSRGRRRILPASAHSPDTGLAIDVDWRGINRVFLSTCVNGPHFDFRNNEFHIAIELNMVQYQHAKRAKKTRPESRVKQMKKDHPWSRGGNIVAPEQRGVEAIIWNSTFQKMKGINEGVCGMTLQRTLGKALPGVALTQQNNG
jgi:hypothetical protein